MLVNRSLQNPVHEMGRRLDLYDYVHTTYTRLMHEVLAKGDVLLQKPDTGPNIQNIKHLIYDLYHVAYKQGLAQKSPYDTIDGHRDKAELCTEFRVDTYLQTLFNNTETDTYQYWRRMILTLAHGHHTDILTVCGLYLWMIRNSKSAPAKTLHTPHLFIARTCACQPVDWLDSLVDTDVDVDDYVRDISMTTHRLYTSSRNCLQKVNTTILPLVRDMDARHMHATITRVYALVYYTFLQGEIDRFMYQDKHSPDLLAVYRKLTDLRTLIGAV